MIRGLILLLGCLFSLGAYAQQQTCPEGYNADTLANQVTTAENHLASMSLRDAKKATKEAMQFARCLQTVADQTVLARLGRTVSMLAFFNQDEAVSTQWALFVTDTAPDLPWPDHISITHPYRQLANNAAFTPVGKAEGFALNPPKKGAIFKNGVLFINPEAYSEIPLFIQVFDKHQRPVDAYWQNGAAFNERWLVAGDGSYKVPKWVETLGQDPSNTSPRKPKGSFPVVQVSTSAGLALLAGGLYAGAAANAGRLKSQTTEKDLRRVRSTSNLMTVGALLSAGAAAGVGVTILVGDTQGVAFRVRF